MYELYIDNGKELLYPALKDGVTFTTERVGVAGKLEFEVYIDENLEFSEGNAVVFKVDGVEIFFGFVFIKKTNGKDKKIKVTCYDQLRYLKNEDTYSYRGLTASSLLSRIAKDFRLNLGDVENTKYRLPSRIEEDKSLFDIVLTALDITLTNTGRLYVLYDDYGAICLKNIEDLKLDLLIDGETFETYDYTSSIDKETYNQIKIKDEDDESGVTSVYMAKDSTNINKWGVLQMVEDADDGVSPTTKANTMLSLYNAPFKELKVKNAVGDKRARAGFSVVVKLSLDDLDISHYMIIQKAKHVFKNGMYYMDLDLVGGDFSGISNSN